MKFAVQVSMELNCEICLKIVELICTAWRKGIRRILHLPNTTHSTLIPDLSDTLLPLHLFYIRVVNFVCKCLWSESWLVNYIARFGIPYGQMDSFKGRHILNCSSRYKISLGNILNLHFQPSDIYSYIRANVGSSVISVDWTSAM